MSPYNFETLKFTFISFRRSDGVMRTVNTEKLLKTIPIIQNQMDVLLDFNVSAHYGKALASKIYNCPLKSGFCKFSVGFQMLSSSEL